MIFSISRAKPIVWPNKCVWCGREPSTSYTIHGIGIIGDERIIAEWSKLEIAKVKYPVCQRHWWWSIGLRAVGFVSFSGVVFSWIIHPILLGISAAMFVLAVRLHPVRIKRVTDRFYKMLIRKDDYGKEFALLNGLDHS